jgi:ribosomal protein L44E
MLKSKCVMCYHEERPVFQFKKLHIGVMLYYRCSKCGYRDSRLLTREDEVKN